MSRNGGSLLWRTLLACRVGTHADAWAARDHKSRHECRLGTHECVRHKGAWATKLTACIAALAFLAAAGCSTVSRTPPVQAFSDMRRQPKYLPQAESAFFSDGRADRTPVPGTVARGDLKEDDAFYTGISAGNYVVNPLPIDRALLEHGQERFNIYCAPCHDRTGSGKGIVAQRATWIAQNLTDQRIRSMPDGQLFDTISHGIRTMPAYRYQISERDRWAIIAYVRALQRAAAGTVADVPVELRSELR